MRPGVTLEGVPVGGLLAHEVRAHRRHRRRREHSCPGCYINKLTGRSCRSRKVWKIDVDEGLYQVITAPRGKEIHLRRYVVQPTLTSAELQRITVVPRPL